MEKHLYAECIRHVTRAAVPKHFGQRTPFTVKYFSRPLAAWPILKIIKHNFNRNRKLLISREPTKAKSQEPAYSQAPNQNKIDRQRSRSRESGRQAGRQALIRL